MRNFLLALSLCLLANVSAGQASREVKIAFISSYAPEESLRRSADIEQELSRRWSPSYGPIPRLRFIHRRFEPSPESLRPIAERDARNRVMFQEVLAQTPDIIYSPGADSAMLAKEFTKTTPIVLACKCNPGPTSPRRLVQNLCAPEANVTGFTELDVRISWPNAISNCTPLASSQGVKLEGLVPIRISLLASSREPGLKRIGLIYGEPYDEAKWDYVNKAAAIGVALVHVKIGASDISRLAQVYADNQLEAGVILLDSFTGSNSRALIDATSKIAMPTIFSFDEAEKGAWMHYGTKVDLAARAVDYFIPLIRGVPVKDLPVSFPTEYELVVNHKLAKQHGWVFPRKFLLLPQREANAP